MYIFDFVRIRAEEGNSIPEWEWLCGLKSEMTDMTHLSIYILLTKPRKQTFIIRSAYNSRAIKATEK